jgi:hypothetical protein
MFGNVLSCSGRVSRFAQYVAPAVLFKVMVNVELQQQPIEIIESWIKIIETSSNTLES